MDPIHAQMLSIATEHDEINEHRTVLLDQLEILEIDLQTQSRHHSAMHSRHLLAQAHSNNIEVQLSEKQETVNALESETSSLDTSITEIEQEITHQEEEAASKISAWSSSFVELYLGCEGFGEVERKSRETTRQQEEELCMIEEAICRSEDTENQNAIKMESIKKLKTSGKLDLETLYTKVEETTRIVKVEIQKRTKLREANKKLENKIATLKRSVGEIESKLLL
ncbi:hypothetical protein ScalyP_jg1500 [Parmales sp. scaly parma]|nr:hypothetical protein ScalyP_jg1500 [Parmales sp. scaly parma]|tara:strand:- start:49 stop:723 length:675 start_codon:yes stop_codon:yes gene_type:complete